jgi:hypothetical protein
MNNPPVRLPSAQEERKFLCETECEFTTNHNHHSFVRWNELLKITKHSPPCRNLLLVNPRSN